jgi:hypothetical protein
MYLTSSGKFRDTPLIFIFAVWFSKRGEVSLCLSMFQGIEPVDIEAHHREIPFSYISVCNVK